MGWLEGVTNDLILWSLPHVTKSCKPYQVPSPSIVQTFSKSYNNLMVFDGIGGLFYMGIVKNSDCVIFSPSCGIGNESWWQLLVVFLT